MVTSDVHDASLDAQHKESNMNDPFATTNAAAEPTDWDALMRIEAALKATKEAKVKIQAAEKAAALKAAEEAAALKATKEAAGLSGADLKAAEEAKVKRCKLEGCEVVLPCIGTRKTGVLATTAGEESEDSDEEESAIHFLEMQDINPNLALQHKPENITIHEYLAYLTRLNEDELEEVLATGQTPTDHLAIAGAEYDPSEAFEVDIILVGAEDDACVDEVMQRVPDGCTPLEFVRDFVELSQAERDCITQ